MATSPVLGINEDASDKRTSALSVSGTTAISEASRYSIEKQVLEIIYASDAKLKIKSEDKPYPGMNKEDLIRFSQTPFWNRLRLACTIIFWLAWFGLLAAVIGLVITFPQCTPPPEKPWYSASVIYQIYVRSFYDTDGDGVGDINGITAKLDYLASIDTDAILLSSIYNSTNEFEVSGRNSTDFGYEVTNHTQIADVYGTMEDFENLITKAHQLGIKIIMDFIPNYTGTNHPWFLASSSSGAVTNPYWNYYVWADCDQGPPNNWVSVYGESMWSSFLNRTGRSQCYLHQFLDSQPELNLRSSVVLDELDAILRFWLDKGVDGFRVVKVKHLFEDADLRNESQINKCNDSYDCFNHTYTTSLDEIYPLIARWRAVLDGYCTTNCSQRVLITDAMDTIDNTLRYYGDYGPDGAQHPLNYALTEVNTSYNGRCMFDVIDPWIYGTPSYGSMNWMTGNQDMTRARDIFFNESNPDDWGLYNSIMMIKMTLPGSALVYYGEEIGMTNVNKTGTIGSKDAAGEFGLWRSRDPVRSPMQWTSESNAGFIGSANQTKEPWLPVGDNLYTISVEAQNSTQYTPFEIYSALTSLRRHTQTFHVGKLHYTLLNDDILSFYREYEGLERYLVAVNFGEKVQNLDIATSHFEVPSEAEIVMTSRFIPSLPTGDMVNLESFVLNPGDGIIARWEYVRPDGKPNN